MAEARREEREKLLRTDATDQRHQKKPKAHMNPMVGGDGLEPPALSV